MANLNHPNIVQVYDYGEEALTLYIVMEYLPDDSVKTYLERVGPMSAELAVHVCLQAGRGLQFMHENGAVHRDIKPGNLLISGSTIKVGDFGLVKGDYDQLQTHSDAVMGTFAFMSPEQRLGSKTVNHQTDIYALTATLYNCLTGEASLDLHEQEERKRLLQGIDPALAQIMEKGLKGSQSERYASMADMVTELETYLATCPNGSDFDLSRIKSEASLQPHDHEHVHRIWAQYTPDGGVTEPLAVDGLESTMAPEELPLSASATRPREASARSRHRPRESQLSPSDNTPPPRLRRTPP